MLSVQRCTELAFQKAAERGDNLPPTLQDFYDAANEQPEEQAQVIALRYERFVKGSMNFFNHQSNVDFNTRIVDFNLKDLPDSMLVFALINVCEAVRNRMPLLPGRCSITSTTSWTDSAPDSTPTRMASGTTASTSR